MSVMLYLQRFYNSTQKYISQMFFAAHHLARYWRN